MNAFLFRFCVLNIMNHFILLMVTDEMETTVLKIFIIMAACVAILDAHGRLLEPPSRASAWRYGFPTPPNYNDNQLFCGGFWVQWHENNGQCGVCGDNWVGPRDHEAPDGKYFTGAAFRKYDVGSAIDVAVHLTANHKGWFEFRLCQNDDKYRPVTQDCFDEHLLHIENIGGTRWKINSTNLHIVGKVRLPEGVICHACVLQWKYNTGNSWAKGPEGECLGCGPQEQFYGCADIAIGVDGTDIPKPDKDKIVIPDGDDDESNPLDKEDRCVCTVVSKSEGQKNNESGAGVHRGLNIVMVSGIAAMAANLV